MACAEGVFVDHDFDAPRTIAKFGGRVGGHEQSGFGLDRGQKAATLCRSLTALPAHPVIAVTFRNEVQLRGAVTVSLYFLGKNVVVLIAAKLELPGLLAFSD